MKQKNIIKHCLRLILACLVLINSSKLALSKELSGYEIMRLSHEQGHKQKYQKYTIKMTILNDSSLKRERYFDFYKYYTPKQNNSLIEYYKPARIKGTKLLTNYKIENNSTKQWIYFPALRTIKIIKSNERSNSFMGSHFSYQDITGRSPDTDNHKLQKQEEHFYYITSIPKKITNQEYSKLNIIIERKSLIPVKIDFYNMAGIKIKTLFNKKISKVKGMFIAMESRMVSHQSKGITTVEVLDLLANNNTSNKLFSIKSLK